MKLAKNLRRTTALFAFLSFSAATAVVGARAVSRRFVFPVGEIEAIVPPREVARLEAQTRDGVLVHSLLIPGASNAPVFVYFHNNRQTMVAGLALARDIASRGFGVVLPEYRGYGLSRGAEPSELGLYADAEAVLDAMNARGIGRERIVLCGMSLGTGVAAEMARRRRGAALLLIAPYTSLPDVVAAVAPFLPTRLLMPDKFDTLAKSPDIRIPTLIVHGDHDEIIPFWMGGRLARSITGARFLRVPGGHHGDLLARAHDVILDEMTSLAASVCCTSRRTG
ncbi:MAG TPA: alpha/beta fold hydrolase [Polyangiaceae bacterium]|nr:alpha/beta fold hydrolase [Polyangiaceae bacterium]